MSVRDTFKRLAYRTGALAKSHRKRNPKHLTVAMFHRVLPEDDPRFAGADPEWTLTDRLFRESLAFFREHYTVLTPEQFEASANDGGALPECPLVLTFDDGWADNAEFAAPILDEFDMAAYLFVVSSAVGRREAFWQERLFDAWKRRTVRDSDWAALWFEAGGTADEASSNWREARNLRRLVARLESLDEARRERLLTNLSMTDEAPSPAQMISEDQLVEVVRAGRMTVGSHGSTHTPLTKAEDLESELRGSREALGQLLDRDVPTLSFPHGRYDARVLERTREAGYRHLFTSDEFLNDCSAGAVPQLLGRINIPAHEIADASGGLAPERLATWLFRREARCLS